MTAVPVTAGGFVFVRGERWRVDSAASMGEVTLVVLSRPRASAGTRTCRLLLPFDRLVPADRLPALEAVTPQRWTRELGAHLSELRIFGRLHAAGRAAIQLLPFQLEPAIALVEGRASRFLLADEVGLGKTIQAGLMLAELRERGWCERALVVTPSGLRQQWADELRRRFDVPAVVVDAARLAALAETLPFDVNPWTVDPVVITSIDFLKQPEVLRSLAGEIWDLVIVDEAHQAAPGSHRHDAIAMVAQRSRHVVLVTATPHAGDQPAYRALCNIGAAGSPDPMLLFRRTRELAGIRRARRVHLLPVRPSPAAVGLHRLLDRYLARLWRIARRTGTPEVRLVAMVLAKRAFSSARALEASLRRRAAALAGEQSAPAQDALPFASDSDSSDEAAMPAVPAFDRIDVERDTLLLLIDAARRAQPDERKLRALERLLRRVREPVIVFTEYRDTLDAIQLAVGSSRRTVALHGGHTPAERSDAIAAFTSGEASLLLATDAGSEGLNLQTGCRLVVNLELPWNPMRLEQRIGRVDRIGQRRTVHAINLLADGTAERTVLASLLRRLDRIHLSEIDVAECVVGRTPPPAPRHREASGTSTVDVRAAALDETQRLEHLRPSDGRAARVTPDRLPVVARRRSHASALAASTAVAFVRLRLVSRSGRLVEDTLVPVHLPFPVGRRRWRRGEVLALAKVFLTECAVDVVRCAERVRNERAAAVAAAARPWVERALARERLIARHASGRASTLTQAGLFDSRALKRNRGLHERRAALERQSNERTALVEAEAALLHTPGPEIALLLFTC